MEERVTESNPALSVDSGGASQTALIWDRYLDVGLLAGRFMTAFLLLPISRQQ
jgi:hypothetical protein